MYAVRFRDVICRGFRPTQMNHELEIVQCRVMASARFKAEDSGHRMGNQAEIENRARYCPQNKVLISGRIEALLAVD